MFQIFSTIAVSALLVIALLVTLNGMPVTGVGLVVAALGQFGLQLHDSGLFN